MGWSLLFCWAMVRTARLQTRGPGGQQVPGQGLPTTTWLLLLLSWRPLVFHAPSPDSSLPLPPSPQLVWNSGGFTAERPNVWVPRPQSPKGVAKPGPGGRHGGHGHALRGATRQPGPAQPHTVIKDPGSFATEALSIPCPTIPELSWQTGHVQHVTEPGKAWVVSLRGRTASLPPDTSCTCDQPSLGGPNRYLAGAPMSVGC